MNMILKKRLADARSAGVIIRLRKGFTLVEVIVVLVILAILAAIAIPALTGYIDKAEDKKYIADARNAVAAYRAVIDEAYADGSLGKGIPTTGKYKDYLTSGEAIALGTTHNIKYFSLGKLSLFANGKDPSATSGPTEPKSKDWIIFVNEASKLIGGKAFTSMADHGIFEVDFLTDYHSTDTLLNAQAFLYRYYPEGNYGLGGSHVPYIAVTYGIGGIDKEKIKTITELWQAIDAGTIDLNAGYNVYHTVSN
jgi:prepilin-type N-terminal cleavage/methylation domain-containing protein